MSGIRTRRWRQDRCRCRTRRAPTVVDVVADAIGIGIRTQSPPHTPRRRVGFRRSRSLLLGCQSIRIVDGARTVAHAALIHGTEAFFLVVADAVAVHVGVTITTAHAKASSWLPSQSQSPSGCQNIRTRRWRQDRADAALVVRTLQSSTSSQMPSASSSATQSPPHTPKASSWFPSQSQSPSGMSEHPHS